jgi:hypothetical protein
MNTKNIYTISSDNKYLISNIKTKTVNCNNTLCIVLDFL